jgi:hypothetical protein
MCLIRMENPNATRCILEINMNKLGLSSAKLRRSYG